MDPIAVASVCRNELSDVLNDVQFVGKFNDCKLLNKNSASYSCTVGSLAESGGEVSQCCHHVTDIVVG
jgi:hypothetical protein